MDIIIQYPFNILKTIENWNIRKYLQQIVES